MRYLLTNADTPPKRLIVALNLGAQPHRLQLLDWARGSRLLLSTEEDAPLVEGGAVLPTVE